MDGNGNVNVNVNENKNENEDMDGNGNENGNVHENENVNEDVTKRTRIAIGITFSPGAFSGQNWHQTALLRDWDPKASLLGNRWT